MIIRRKYPFNLDYVLKMASGLAPVKVPNQPDRYVLGLGLTDYCNFKCPMCYYHGEEALKTTQDMPISLLQNILIKLPYLASILIGLEGEPLLHKQIFQAFEIMSQHTDSLILFTNGSRLTSSVCQTLNKYPVRKIFLSIDAANDEDYTKYRSGGTLDLFKRHAEYAVHILGSEKIQLHATIFHENMSSVQDLPRLAKSIGIGRISLQQLREHDGSKQRGISPASNDELETFFNLLLDEAHKYDIELMPDRSFGGPQLDKKIQAIANNDPLVIHSEYESCIHVEIMAGILADGSLFPCAGDFEPVQLDEYSFDSIFNHPYLQSLRAINRQKRTTMACKICRNAINLC